MKGVPVTALPHPLTLVSEGGAAVLYVWALALNACISTSYSLRKYAVMSQVRCKKKKHHRKSGFRSCITVYMEVNRV